MTTTETAPERHWVTRYDPDDNSAYGELCDCGIGRHHDGNGDLSEPDEPDRSSSVTAPEPGTDVGDIETDNLHPEIATPAPTLAELIAEQLCSIQVVEGRVIRLKATIEDDGRYIVLDVTQVEFEAEADTTVRVLLHLSEPITVAPAAEAGAEIGASA